MIELINNVPNKNIATLSTLKSSSLPVVIYGAGSYAQEIYEFLTKRGVKIESFCIDANYLEKTEPVIQGVTVSAIEQISKKYPELEIVIGFADYQKARTSLQRLGHNRIYFIDAPNHENFFDYSYVVKNQGEFTDTYEMLADQRSKDILVAFVNSKVSGDPSDLYKFAEFNQYFPSIMRFSDSEVFVDCGAFDGDTVTEFVYKVKNRYQKIYAFEPDISNYKKLVSNIKKNQIKNVEAMNLGTWSKAGALQFSGDGTIRSNVTLSGGVDIMVNEIDQVVKDSPVSFIKMDIEGAELESLRGAEKTIKTNRPKLAICVYHRPEDLITIPQYIKSLVGEYKIYLRQHQFVSWDLVLYAVSE